LRRFEHFKDELLGNVTPGSQIFEALAAGQMDWRLKHFIISVIQAAGATPFLLFFFPAFLLFCNLGFRVAYAHRRFYDIKGVFAYPFRQITTRRIS
jgi:hypothetical protein